MNRITTTLTHAAAAAALGAAALGAAAQSHDLTVVSWGGAYQDGQKEVYFKPFNATGIKLLDESWDGGLGVLRTKIKGGNNAWDVVQVEADELEVGCDEGLYEKLDVNKIGGTARYLPGTVHACGVGAIIYNLVLAYDGDKLKTAPTGWADFFDTKKFPGKRAIRNGAKWNLEVALIADGVPSKDVYKTLRTPEGIERAFKKLDSIKSDLVFWKSGAQPPQMLAAGDVVFTTAYNGRITAANEKDKKNFKMVWKDTPYTMDSWVIMKGTPNKANAEKLVEFMGRPENQAKLPKYVRYGVTSAAAAPLVDKSLMAELPTNPDILKQAFAEEPKFWIDNGDKLAERWTQWSGTK
ncbi:MAG TPA: ABC transporter substrate-binding protein [Burkholderiaceae bacterium]|nr:ABC transporter substrate-binding protein [Burkholderiaceae bacterium]HSB98760.1 ABC transporter substrate-binding protein [Burkholderiaceae bacterium]